MSKTISKNNLTEGIIWRQLLTFAIPIVISNLLQQLYNAVDLVIVGQYGPPGSMGSIGATGSLTNLLVGLFVGLSSGANVLISQRYGAGDREGVSKAVHTSITLCIVSSVIIMAIAIPFTPALLELMGTPSDLIDGSVTYMRIYFSGILLILLYNFGAGILRAVGDSRRPLFFLLTSSVVNIVLDYTFVKPFGWGVAGAAWATVISEAVAAVLVIICLLRTDDCHHLSLKQLRIDRPSAASIFKIGLPAGMQSIVFSLSNVVIQSKINLFESAAVSGCAAASKVDGFVFTPTAAFGIAISSFAGQNYGAGKFDRARKSTHVCILISASFIMALGFLIAGFAEPIVSIFNSDPEIVHYGSRMVRVICTTYWIYAIYEVFSGSMRAAGATTTTMAVSLICICGVRLAWIYTMLPINPDIDTVFFSYPISWAVTALVLGAFYYQGSWLRRYKKRSGFLTDNNAR